jgi:hypothetical protein
MPLVNPEIKVMIFRSHDPVLFSTFVKVSADILGAGKVQSVSYLEEVKDIALQKALLTEEQVQQLWLPAFDMIYHWHILDDDKPTRFILNQVLLSSASLLIIQIWKNGEIDKCVAGLKEMGVKGKNIISDAPKFENVLAAFGVIISGFDELGII